MQKVKIKKMSLCLACDKNHDGFISILCMVLNIFFTFFPSILNCINLCDVLQLCDYYMGVICTKSKNEQNVKANYEFGNDPMEVCFDRKTRIKVDHRNKSIKFL